MRRRLTLTFLVLTGLLMLAFGVPLAYSLAMNDFHHFAVGRLNESARLAATAAPVVASDRGWLELRARIEEFDRSTGVTVIVVNTSGAPVLTSRPDPVIDRPRWREELDRALRGERSNVFDYKLNIRSDPLFIAEPVEDAGRVLGALVTISSTTSLAGTVGRELLVFAGVGVVGLVGAAAASILLSRWTMRPIRRLSQACRAVSAGHLDSRAPGDAGPPEVRELGRAFNLMTDRLVATLRAQRAFVADASHQLRNPLSAMRLRVETLEPLIPDAGRAQFTSAVAEVERLSRILDELLALARAEGREDRVVRVDVAAVVRQRAEAWRPLAEQRGVEVTTECTRTFASAARGTVDQVLDVFIDNAIEVAPPGSAVTVRCTATRENRVEVHVVDEGPGMSEGDRRRAADRFWRGPGTDRDGLGLGLSVASALLQASGGRLSLEAAPGRGLDAVADLPAWTRDAEVRTRSGLTLVGGTVHAAGDG